LLQGRLGEEGSRSEGNLIFCTGGTISALRSLQKDDQEPTSKRAYW